MKRNLIIGLFGLSAAALLGCPVFSGGSGGTGPCGEGYGSGSTDCSCSPEFPCSNGYSCNYETSTCEPSGFDGGFSDVSEGGGGACDGGCKTGEVCAVVDAAAVCVPAPDGGGKDGSSDTTPPFKGCTSNASCADAGTGYICLDGTCVAPSNQCTDTQQCPGTEQCVDGACVPGCSTTSPCPTGYSCQYPGGVSSGNGVCTGNPTPCGGAPDSGTCAAGSTCVDQHCVPKCSTGDVACKGTGDLVCVDDGCIPNQVPVFVCNTDGQAGDGKTGDCAVGSVCLHHACYISCDPYPDADTNHCNEATGGRFTTCTSTSESGNSYSVCGSSTSLGTQCSPTTPCTGSGQVCIDGYCE
jgi:hypothetical protein